VSQKNKQVNTDHGSQSLSGVVRPKAKQEKKERKKKRKTRKESPITIGNQ
jgi:hypothetical protein